MRAFQYLVEYAGYRSIACESDCLAGLKVNTFVEDGEGWLIEVTRTGFSPGFGKSAANRELVDWMREYNESHTEKLRFYGFDAPAADPRPVLAAVHAYLGLPWDVSEIKFANEAKLRVIADDLLALVAIDSARLIAETSYEQWWRASWRARVAAGLLRDQANAVVADNLKQIMAREERRGPTLVLTRRFGS
ncbi:Erythromycin esterase [Amycolatopsis xylanica]|uniref:Erythromycin esterase n=1 Tax=Amycolatopsis xylanica TaxID=589385 RepID=A0A1H2ZLK6_9PSEU|nr:erythromycin esterase family protein [Amycolatopsis xylanica]SDX18261.1 Erythromycin esterase [Amycolatopsis xylanica]